MKLICQGEEFEAEKIVKNSTDIIGYYGDREVFAFRGIKDFDLFELEDGQGYDLDSETKIQLAIADLDMQREMDKTELQLAIAELAETILGGM